MMLFDFRCTECDEVNEELVHSSTKEVHCDCGGMAKRIISPVRSKLEGMTGSFPGAHIKFAKDRMKEVARQAKIDSKNS